MADQSCSGAVTGAGPRMLIRHGAVAVRSGRTEVEPLLFYGCRWVSGQRRLCKAGRTVRVRHS